MDIYEICESILLICLVIVIVMVMFVPLIYVIKDCVKIFRKG